jgi:hypothetical protein
MSLKKITAMGAAAALLAPAMLSFAPLAAAEQGHMGVGVGLDVDVSASTTEAHGNSEMHASTSMMDDDEDSHASGSMKDEMHATTTGAKHRSDVATQVQILLNAADRDGGIGAEVRDIAHAYASTTAKMDDEKSSVENRPGWVTFLIGADYKNLGALRSDLSTTQNQITRLMRAASSTTDASVQADLEAQIDALQDSASTTASFVADHESKFSLFGWFFHAFNK